MLSLIVLVAGVLYVTLLGIVLRRFVTSWQLVLPFLVLPLVYSLGYALRLTYHPFFVDLGYYLTDMSYFFVTLLFTTALFMGQFKYWKIES
jgi:hypothetical protein